jgi:hypothetical protein
MLKKGEVGYTDGGKEHDILFSIIIHVLFTPIYYPPSLSNYINRAFFKRLYVLFENNKIRANSLLKTYILIL